MTELWSRVCGPAFLAHPVIFCALSLQCWPDGLELTSRILSGIQRAAQTVLGVYLKRTCSRVTSASSALGVLSDYALYKSTHSLTQVRRCWLRYIMKTDDDVFVNLFALLHHLTDLYVAGFRLRLIACLVFWRMHVLREGQWNIPVEELPDDLYPPYCSGMGYVFSTDVAVAMYRVSFYVRFFWVRAPLYLRYDAMRDAEFNVRSHTHTHTRLTALFPGLPGWADTRKVKPIWILLKQETVSGSGISWAMYKSAPRSRQVTMPAPHHSVFTGRMPFLSPNQQCQSTEGTHS